MNENELRNYSVRFPQCKFKLDLGCTDFFSKWNITRFELFLHEDEPILEISPGPAMQTGEVGTQSAYPFMNGSPQCSGDCDTAARLQF